MVAAAINPYWGNHLGQFFITLLTRLGKLGNGLEFASDEVQLLVLLAISVSCSLIGNFLVLRKMTMLANSLSHTILLGIVGAQIFWMLIDKSPHGFLSLPMLLLASLISALLTAWLTKLITKKARLDEGAGVGLIFTALFALGLVSLTLFTRDTHIGTEIVMGNIDTLHQDDASLAWSVAAINIAAIFILYRVLKTTSFDLSFARALGLPCKMVDAIFILLTAATVIASFRAVGVLLVLAYLTGPVLAARLLSNRLLGVIGYSILLSSLSSLFAVALSRHLLSAYHIAVSTSGLAVVLIAIVFIATVFGKWVFSKYSRRAILASVCEKRI